uniref:Immunoglobulin domain-containing protein n=1 Tax=Cyprinus carpio TaxID=7962 RepID=A0A8C2EHL5_CYPCA
MMLWRLNQLQLHQEIRVLFKITTEMQLLINFVVWILLVSDLNFKLFTSVNHHEVILKSSTMTNSVCVCSSGVFADSDAVKSVSVMQGNSVSLQTNTELQTDDVIMWSFGQFLETRIAEFNKCFERFSTYDVLDGRFRDRLKLDHQTGSLTITNTRTTDSGLYGVETIRNTTVILYRFNLTVSGVFADSDAVKSVSVKEGDSVTLQTNTELQTDDEIMWTFGHSQTLIADINAKHRVFSTIDVLDGRFRDRLKLDYQTGSLTITNTTTTHSGLYGVTIRSRTDITYRFNLTVSGESQLQFHS